MKNYLLFVSIMFFALNAFSQNALTDSLVAYYPFNGNANDATGHGSDGTVYGATLTTDRFGNANSAYYFDGVSNYITYLAGTDFKPATLPISITAWIKTNSTNIGTIFSNDNTIDIYGGVVIDYDGSVNYITMNFNSDGTPSPNHRRGKDCPVSVNDNQWHFVAAVIRGPNDMDLYVDCNYVTGTYTGNANSFAYSNSGGITGHQFYTTSSSYYNGSIDEIRLYHRALTQTDLQLIYSYPKPIDNLSVSFTTDTSTLCNVGQPVLLNPAVNGTPLSYQWSNNSTADTISVNQAGNYAVTVFDGCRFATDTATVLNGGNVVAGTISAVRDTICANTPGNLSLAGNSSNIIQWQSSADDTTYTAISGATSVNYKTPPLQQSTWYHAVVSAGNCSATTDSLLLYVPPALIAHFNYTQTSGRSFNFNSDSSIGNISNYHWNFGDNATNTNNNPSHTYAKDSTYYVCLTLYDGSNCSYTYCKYVNILVTGVENIPANQSLQLYPNPTSEQLTVSSEQLLGDEITIMDLLGRTIITQTIPAQTKQTTTDVSGLTAGVYFITFHSENGNVVRKFVKE